MLMLLVADPVLAAAQNSFLGYGVVGAIALGGITFAWRAYQRESRRADLLDERNQALHERIYVQVIPAVIAATEAVSRASDRRQSGGRS